MSILNFICLTSDESALLERLFSKLPRHGLGFKHIKSQNDYEKEQELINLLKMLWMVEMLKFFTACIFLSIF